MWLLVASLLSTLSLSLSLPLPLSLSLSLSLSTVFGSKMRLEACRANSCQKKASICSSTGVARKGTAAAFAKIRVVCILEQVCQVCFCSFAGSFALQAPDQKHTCSSMQTRLNLASLALVPFLAAPALEQMDAFLA